MIDAVKFTRFMDDCRERQSGELVTPFGTFPETRETRVSKQHYVLRQGLVWLIQHALAADSGLTNVQRLRVARELSNPEVEAQSQRWAEQFEGMSQEEKYEPLSIVYALASDACAVVRLSPRGDTATATDGNGDVGEEEAA